MLELDFQVTGVEAALRGLTPLLLFKLKIAVSPPEGSIQSLLLNAQIQIQAPQRTYNAAEKERLSELFGTPERWGQTLRNRLWTHASATIGAFSGGLEAILAVPCTYDLNIAAAKYFYALEGGEVPILFLFSGSIFYEGPDGRLQVGRVSWNKECAYRLPVETWKKLMEAHFPNSAWLYLHRDTFDKLWAYRRQHGHATWEETLDKLLSEREPAPEREEITA
jgi:hypothetical protein